MNYKHISVALLSSISLYFISKVIYLFALLSISYLIIIDIIDLVSPEMLIAVFITAFAVNLISKDSMKKYADSLEDKLEDPDDED